MGHQAGDDGQGSKWHIATIINQGQELRGVLSTLLLHYILLEDIVLEAEGSVAEDPKDCSILHIYV